MTAFIYDRPADFFAARKYIRKCENLKGGHLHLFSDHDYAQQMRSENRCSFSAKTMSVKDGHDFPTRLQAADKKEFRIKLNAIDDHSLMTLITKYNDLGTKAWLFGFEDIDSISHIADLEARKRRIAFRLHPDRCKLASAEQCITIINTAYDDLVAEKGL